MVLRKFKKLIQFDTAGWIALSGLLICVISGILMAIPYDISHPHNAFSALLLFNSAATVIRNFHYWSAQLFFIFTILHIYDHLRKSTETNIKNRRTWLMLTIVTVMMGYEMISGFILKGDAGGIQARRIIGSLLESVPLAGKMLRLALAGTEENWQIVYIQHVATGTILLFVGVYEHVRSIWPRQKTFVVVFTLLLLLSLLFRAPLGQVESSQIKGPWFFVGIQELLYLTSNPGYLILIFGIVILPFFFLPVMSEKNRTIVKRVLLTVSISYLVITIFAFWFRGENWQGQGWKGFANSGERVIIFDPVNLVNSGKSVIFAENQKKEGCLVCHSAMSGLSDSHKPATIGCFACHKGDPFSADKAVAHRNMIKIPGNFSNVGQTCGTQNCHPEIAGRVLNSLMTTQSGIIAVDKFVFKESKSLNDTFHVLNLSHSAADTHLRNLCAGCHLGNEKVTVGNAAWPERGGGCNACHLHYNDQALNSLKRMKSKLSDSNDEVHPTIDIQVSNDRCKSCHSRSGRISLSYEGWNETTLTVSEVTDSICQKVLPDERVVKFVQADIHHQKGLGCIDCHGSYDVMGDGKHKVHKEDAVNVQCIDCHPSGKPKSADGDKLPDRESQLIGWLRKYNTRRRVVVTAKGGVPLINTQVDSLGNILLTDKLTGKNHISKPLSPSCTKGKGHERLSCESCHTSWVPQCIGCHNVYEKDTKGFDLLNNTPAHGTWVEYAGKNFARPPVLGISEKVGSKVVTAMPGMVMTIDKVSFGKDTGTSFHRLFAPASGHTTVREARNCKSCHNNSLALGFGEGDLNYRISGAIGTWEFKPRFVLNVNDSLPEDAWTGFLKEAKRPISTRSWLRPFNVNEQKRMLKVGSCLTCHEGKSKVMDMALDDFGQTLNIRKQVCILPNW